MIYADYNATAPLRPEARDAMLAAMSLSANPSSVHGPGRAARKAVEHARNQVGSAIGAAAEQVQLALLEVERRREELRLATANEYYDLQAAIEAIRISQAFLAEAERNLQDTSLREEVGVGTRFDVLRAEVQVANARQDLVNSERSRQVAQRALARRLNVPPSLTITTVPVDIADRESVVAAAEKVGAIDGIVFLAGVYWPIKATEWDAEAAETMADINFTGAFRCLGAVVPDMVKRGSGHVVITGSLSGFRGLPGAIGYGATKAGVMSLAETMKFDLKDTGVDVQLINPGFIKTRMTDKNEFNMPFIMEPEAAAELFVQHMRTERFSLSFPWLFSRVFRGSQFLPDWLYYRVFRM